MKSIVVIIRAGERERIAEALRAAVGLALRGDAICVLLTGASRARAKDPASQRAVATLTALGHQVVSDEGQLSDLVHRADAVEVWT